MKALDIILLVALVLGNLMALALWWRLFGRPLAWAWRLFFRRVEKTAARPIIVRTSGFDQEVCNQFS